MSCARSAISEPLAMLRGRASALLAATALLLAGCGVVRPSDFPQVCPNYDEAIRPLVEARCAQCHSPTRAEGGYVIGLHTQTVSRRDDGTARVDPGNDDSLFLQAARGTLPGHPEVGELGEEERKALEHWVVACRGAPQKHEYHPRGWATSTDPDQFHGVALRAKFYRFGECQKCHGDDLRGGKSGVDCNSCHVKGPLECSTCHGDETSAAPPKDLSYVRLTTSLGVGAHRAHVTDGPAHKAYGCAQCHQDVQNVEDEGHYRRRGVFLTGPAEVILSSGPGGIASWDRTTATCTNSACHAPSPADTASTKRDPVWTRTGEISCGSCHGAPPSSHAQGNTQCELCHGVSYAGGGVDFALHLNGTVDVRGGGLRCDACHAGPDSPTFVDLQGRGTDAGVRTVGAHDAHLHASRLRGPLTCNECHLVPENVSSPGHLDSAGPAEVTFDGGIGSSFGAVAVYDASNATCANYCHGGGDFGHPDTAPGLLRLPSWTGGSAQAACGTCHGLPPQDGTAGHLAAVSLACAACHSGTVGADGGLLFSTGPDGGLTSKHLDGKLTGQ